MKLFDEWKLKRECKKSGKETEYHDYLNVKEAWKKEHEMYIGFLKKAEDNLSKMSQTDSGYNHAYDEVNRWRYTLAESSLKEEFIRPNSKDDIQYRERIIDDFSTKIKEILGDDDTIRFHGTPIYFTREILKSGAILSSSARFDGYNKSTDLKDEISVSTADSIDRTLSFFTDLYSFQSCLPAGCLFVLKSSEVDAELAKYSAMKSFDFKESPERLLGICTTQENIPRVKEWLKMYGYNENLVYSFEGFLSIASSLKSKREENKVEEDEQTSIVNTDELLDELENEVTVDYNDSNVKIR